jgi:hypothetical protein
MFFLSFDQLGSSMHTFVEPTYNPPSQPAPTAQPVDPDFGIATFERAYHTMSTITGVNFNDQPVATMYNSIQQSMPAGPQIAAFLATHQTAFSQLAGAYCGELVTTASYRTAFFGSSLEGSLTAPASSFFSTSSNMDLVVNPLSDHIVGTVAYPQAAANMKTELKNLSTTIPTLSSGATVSTAMTAACTAALGSAATTLQ